MSSPHAAEESARYFRYHSSRGLRTVLPREAGDAPYPSSMNARRDDDYIWKNDPRYNPPETFCVGGVMVPEMYRDILADRRKKLQEARNAFGLR